MKVKGILPGATHPTITSVSCLHVPDLPTTFTHQCYATGLHISDAARLY